MADEVSGFDTSPQPLTIQYVKRSVVMLTVTKDELESVSGLSGSIYLAFFGTCLGALVSFGIVLSTTAITNALVFAAYVSLTGVATLGSIFFGIKSVQEYRGCRRRLRRLKQEED